MRKLIVSNLISLDGYAAGPEGDVMALPFDDSFSLYNVERLRNADTLLLGATSYEGFRDYWPSIADDEQQPALEREISAINNRIHKVVVSDRLTAEDAGVWSDTTTILRRSEAHDKIAELKRGEGGDILMFGSITLANDLLAHGLVDELHLQVGNAAIGDGVPMFSAGTGTLKLLDVRRMPQSDHVRMIYTTA